MRVRGTCFQNMSEPCLLINGKEELELDRALTTIGRASDNVLAFTEDSNVSRYHAEIEKRGDGDFWLFDLNSSNGTMLNGERLTAERPLSDGDSISIGGSQKVQFFLNGPPKAEAEEEEDQPEEEAVETEDEPAPEEEAPAEEEPESRSKLSVLFIVAGLAIGLAVISVVVVAVIFMTGGGGGGNGGGGLFGSSCEAQATIVKPQNGDILNTTSAIQIELSDPRVCVQKAIYTIDGEAIASSEEPPFDASIDPNQFPGLSDGLDHNLKVVLMDADGNEIPQTTEVALNFDTLVTDTPPPGNGTGNGSNPGNDNGGPQQQQTPQQNTSVSLNDTKTMSEQIIGKFSGQGVYVTGNAGFLDAVNRMTLEYAEPGYFERARKYRDVINTEFVQERGLDPPLGFILAMARSKFQPTNDPAGAGLWRMDNKLVLEYRYNGLCGTETIAGEKQSCAAIAASNYVKDIQLKVFGGNPGDIIYVVAAFGMSPLDAAKWKETLPEDRKDFWNILSNDPQKQDAVARFFAAAIVTENPGRFGLKDDRPLSELYATRAAAP